LTGLAAWPLTATAAPLDFTTLNFDAANTFLTGIRGDNIVGNYVVPGTTSTGGLLYNQTTGTFAAFPVATASGVNYPGATVSSPYGPSFGSQYGVLRAVGSYQTTASSPYNQSYLYDGAAGAAGGLTTLVYPSAPGAPTLETIAHSTFGDQVVGNYDTRIATGNAFIYTISTGAYVTNNVPGALSTTAYGVFGNKIAGGYTPLGVGGGPGLDRGYIYNETTGRFTSYNHPGAVFTHFEGITGGGRNGTYNLVADWAGTDGVLHASVLHLDGLGGRTWVEIDVPGASTTSANSIYGNEAIGVYTNAKGVNGYTVPIPGIYNPILNAGSLTVAAPGVSALSGVPGDDIVNNGFITATGVNSIGIHSNSYGVVTNNGRIAATGLTGAGVDLNGAYGTLLNNGTITAALGADAIRTGPAAIGTTIVNDGVIDGRVIVSAGDRVRFENSGWLGVSALGAGVPHAISGTFVQTATGTLTLRVANKENDSLQSTGTVRLAGTEVSVFQSPSGLTNSYVIVGAAGGVTGAFDKSTAVGLPSFVTAALGYAPNQVTLNLTSGIAQQAGLSSNQAAVGRALDKAFNVNGSLPAGLEPIFGLTSGQLPGALSPLSGEAHASAVSAAFNDASLPRNAILDRLSEVYGTLPPVGLAAYTASDAPATPYVAPGGLTFWGQGLGSTGRIGGDGNSSTLERTAAGFILGGDVTPDPRYRIGAVAGFTNSWLTVDPLASSGSVETVFAGVYGGAALNPWRLRGGALFGHNEYQTQRTIAFPGFFDTTSSRYGGSVAQAFGEVGYRLDFPRYALEPFVGGMAMNIHTNAFTESGGPAALTGASRSFDFGATTLGLRAETPIVAGLPLLLKGLVGWRHVFGDVTPNAQLAFASTPGTPFTVAGAPIARDSALLEANLDWKVTANTTAGLSYSGEFASHTFDDTIRGKIEVAF
jgi:uncharacterized protein with beta-barrel porin domain